jgi:hypothetical protein
MKVIIDHQVISFISGIFSIRPISRFTSDELENIAIMTWGSRSLDNKVISLLMTNHIQISDVFKLTTDDINDRISARYFTLLYEDRKNSYKRRLTI